MSGEQLKSPFESEAPPADLKLELAGRAGSGKLPADASDEASEGDENIPLLKQVCAGRSRSPPRSSFMERSGSRTARADCKTAHTSRPGAQLCDTAAAAAGPAAAAQTAATPFRLSAQVAHGHACSLHPGKHNN